MSATLRPVLDGLFDVFEEVQAGTLAPRVGTALARIAGALAKVHQVGTLAEPRSALEAAQGAQGGQGTP